MQAGTSSVNATGPDLWKFVQEAYVGSKVPHVRDLVLQAGVFLAPVGCEALAVKDNWNWSRSNLFFGLWNYQTGARALYDLTAGWSLSIGVYNGWNSVVDNNRYKSVEARVAYHLAGRLLAQFLYFGGWKDRLLHPKATLGAATSISMRNGTRSTGCP